MSTQHQAETLNTLLATVIAKSRPDGMLKAAESAATAFKAALAVFEGAPAADLATVGRQVAELMADKQRTLEGLATLKKVSDSSRETFDRLLNKWPAPQQDPPQKS